MTPGEEARFDLFTILIKISVGMIADEIVAEEGVETDVSGGQVDVTFEEDGSEQPGGIFG